MKRIKRVIIYLCIFTTLFCFGMIKTNACVRSINVTGSSRRVNGHQTQWFNNGTVAYEGSATSASCFNISGGGDVVTVVSTGTGFQFQPHKIGTANVNISVKSSCLCSGVSSISKTISFILSEWGLSKLSVDNYSISPTFYNATFNYSLSVPYETSKITVRATPNQSNSTISGTGEHTLNVGTNRITINVRTPQGDSRNYYIDVTRGQIVQAKSIKINGGNLSLRVNDEKQLTYTITPSNASINGLTWSSSNPNVVTVNNGKIKTVGPGDATVRLQLNNLYSEIKVNVTKGVTSIKATDAMIISKNLSYQLEYSVLPYDATNKKVKFSVNNNLIKISDDGIITAGNKTGTSILTITSVDSGIKKDITVIISSDLEEISFKQKAIAIKKGEQLKLNPIFTPSDVVLEPEELTWTTDNAKIVSVDEGNITAVSSGIATINASFKDVSKDIKVYVLDKDIVDITDINVPEEITLLKNTEKKIEYTVLPENASIKDVFFKPNNDLLIIDEDGNISANSSAGETIITVSSYDDAIKKTIKVNIIDEIKVTDIDVPKELKLVRGDKYQLKCEVYPEDATNKTLTFKASNNLVTVDQNGLITAGDKNGMSTVTVSSHDGLINKSITIEIMNKIQKIAFEKSNYTIDIGAKERLYLNITPEEVDLDYSTLTWSSSNEAIASVSNDGIVTGVKGGTVVVKAVTDDGLLAATTTINVPSEEAGAGLIIIIILICISIPIAIIAIDYFRQNKRR